MKSPHIRNIILDIVFTVLTFGLFNFYVQHRQCEALNEMIGHHKYSFWKWLGLIIITFGLYHIYHEYTMSKDLVTYAKADANEPIINVVLTVMALPVIADAIQQSHINRYFERRNAS